MYTNLWQIPRSNKTDRCAVCFRPFRKGQLKQRDMKLQGQRYTKVHLGCLTKIQ